MWYSPLRLGVIRIFAGLGPCFCLRPGDQFWGAQVWPRALAGPTGQTGLRQAGQCCFQWQPEASSLCGGAWPAGAYGRFPVSARSFRITPTSSFFGLAGRFEAIWRQKARK